MGTTEDYITAILKQQYGHDVDDALLHALTIEGANIPNVTAVRTAHNDQRGTLGLEVSIKNVNYLGVLYPTGEVIIRN